MPDHLAQFLSPLSLSLSLSLLFPSPGSLPSPPPPWCLQESWFISKDFAHIGKACRWLPVAAPRAQPKQDPRLVPAATGGEGDRRVGPVGRATGGLALSIDRGRQCGTIRDG